MVQLSGAGILIIEKYKNKICFTVFKSPQGYNEPGGLIDAGETKKETACRECLEETANLIKLFPNNLSEFVVVNKYIAFIVYLEGLKRQDYFNNLKITKESCPHQWNETTDIKRIPISNIDLKIYSPVFDIDGNKIILRMRTYRIIQEAMKIINKIIQKQPLHLQKYIDPKQNKCLIGTLTYSIQNTELCSIVVAPDSQFNKYKNIRKCDKKFGGIHIKVTDFGYQPIDLLDNLRKNKKYWTPEVMEQHKNKIVIRSNTLDDFSMKLNDLGFKKIKGLIFSNAEWHLSYDCDNIDDLLKILSKSTWSVYLICFNKKIKWKQLFRL